MDGTFTIYIYISIGLYVYMFFVLHIYSLVDTIVQQCPHKMSTSIGSHPYLKGRRQGIQRLALRAVQPPRGAQPPADLVEVPGLGRQLRLLQRSRPGGCVLAGWRGWGKGRDGENFKGREGGGTFLTVTSLI